jgi:hypothetical protein
VRAVAACLSATALVACLTKRWLQRLALRRRKELQLLHYFSDRLSSLFELLS